MAGKRGYVNLYLKCSYSAGLIDNQFQILISDPKNQEVKAVLPDGREFPPRGMRTCSIPKGHLAHRYDSEKGLVKIEGIMNPLEQGNLVVQMVNLDEGGLCNILVYPRDIVVGHRGKLYAFEEVRSKMKFYR
jgi:hypothetical protein